MPLFLVERYLPHAELHDLADRAATGAAIAGDAPDVTYHWCLVAAADATAFCLFEAPDATTVTDLNRRGAFRIDRVTPVSTVPLA